MHDLLLPATDHAVAVQAAVIFPAFLIAVAASYRHRDLQRLVVGLAMCTAGVLGLRMLH